MFGPQFETAHSQHSLQHEQPQSVRKSIPGRSVKRWKSYTKLRAIHTKKIQPIASHAHVQELDHALVLMGISLWGHPSSLQAFRCAQYHNFNNSCFHACIVPSIHQLCF